MLFFHLGWVYNYKW